MANTFQKQIETKVFASLCLNVFRQAKKYSEHINFGSECNSCLFEVLGIQFRAQIHFCLLGLLDPRWKMVWSMESNPTRRGRVEGAVRSEIGCVLGKQKWRAGINRQHQIPFCRINIWTAHKIKYVVFQAWNVMRSLMGSWRLARHEFGLVRYGMVAMMLPCELLCAWKFGSCGACC